MKSAPQRTRRNLAPLYVRGFCRVCTDSIRHFEDRQHCKRACGLIAGVDERQGIPKRTGFCALGAKPKDGPCG